MRQLGADANEPSRRAPTTGVGAKERARVFLNQVRKTPAFWNLIGIHYWGCAGHSIVIVFLPLMVVDALRPEGGFVGTGLLSAAAIGAGAAATMSLVSTITRFGVPVAADLFGSKWVMAICFFLQFAPVSILFFADTPWMFYMFSVLFGIGFGGEMSAFPYYQPAILRQRANRQRLRVPDDGSRLRHGLGRPGRHRATHRRTGSRFPDLPRQPVLLDDSVVFRDESHRRHSNHVPAQHSPATSCPNGKTPFPPRCGMTPGPAPAAAAPAPAGSGDGN